MPDISRLPLRMDCSGLDLTHPLDRMPPGSFGYLFNARILVEGRIDGRPGYTEVQTMADTPNSIRRLNDPSKVFAAGGYTYIGGGGSNLYAGPIGSYAAVDSGYSGDPLSLIPFRPDQSPESWMYVYDKNKLAKVRPDGVVRAVGIAPPSEQPSIEYGVPATVDITKAQATAGWAATGASGAISLGDRTNGDAPVAIAYILYNTGSTGWCCISPTVPQPFWMGQRMKVILSAGPETVVVREIHNAITSTTIAAIQYDTGTTGLCSMVLTGSPIGLARNSLLRLAAAETVRVLEVNLAPNGTDYSIRCVTTGTRAAGDAVAGLLSWYVYTVNNHTTADTISSAYVAVSQAGAGTGSATLTVAVDASKANSRPVSLADDYLHISVFLQNPQNVTNIQLLLSLDATPNFSFSNPGNSLIWTITQAQLDTQGSSGDAWAEVVVPLSAGVRSGIDLTRTLANITGVAVQLTSTGACAYGFDWWYLFGTYGSVIQPNSPVGTVYQSRFRDSAVGSRSVPGPQTRYQLYPLREAVTVTPVASNQAGVDTIDIYRQGGAVTSPLYVASVVNNFATPNSYTDGLPDTTVLTNNQPPDLNAIQPWPLLDSPWSTTATIVGTSVIWTAGTHFNVALLSNSVILINGTAFLTHGQPRSTTFLELTQDAGSATGAVVQIASPTLAGQPLPYAFGALEGPFAPVIFALGDPLNGGLLYFSNFNDADSASDANTLELAPPSNDLVSGDVWNGLCFAGNRDHIFCIRYSYLTTIGASNSTSYQWAKINSPSGIWSRWACCACPVGLAFLGRDGLYIATDNQAVNITDEKLYPMFPHDGQVAKSINSGSNIILPVDMTLLTKLRLTYCDEELRFSYVDTGGNYNTLIYEIFKKRWFLNNYANELNMHYLVEDAASGPNDPEILAISLDTNSIMMMGGNTDKGAAINTLVLTPSMDGGDERTQKLFVDAMIQADGTGTLQTAVTYDNAQSFSPVLNLGCTGTIVQFLQNIASLLNLALHRNVGAKFAWTGGPDGPRLYAWETAGFVQPYLSTFFVTQFIGLSFPGWKSHRRMYPALISTAPVYLTIQTQDGRTFGPYTIQSTAGQFRILPQMLDQNLKDLAFAYQLDGKGVPFAFFPNEFVIETKEWNESTYINLAVFKA